MGLIDYIIMFLILAGAGYLFYRSFFKKGGGCAGCAVSNCELKGIAAEHSNSSNSLYECNTTKNLKGFK